MPHGASGARSAAVVPVGQDKGVNELKQRLRTDLNSAMRARDQVRLRTLRMALSSITNEEVSGAARGNCRTTRSSRC